MEMIFAGPRTSRQHQFSGGCVERATPVPIPNTEVKPLGADGTARATVWESRKPPGLLNEARERNLAGFFVCFLTNGNEPRQNSLALGRFKSPAIERKIRLPLNS